ncbi:MAG TPA: ABC transporter ATP-binding protein, partial [Ilumatobacteraceae bacterium]|nr:ABC transporter ATP-binding protein [Ilumatobacteraceae bacterium]
VVDDLNVTYRSSRGPIPAVRGVSLSLEAGETLGLAGESGSGKSSLIMALLRLVPPGTKVTGSVTLAGEDVLAMKPGRLRAVRWAEAAVVFQGAQHVLNPVRRVGQQIQEAIDCHAGDNKVDDLLEQVGIPRWRRDAYPHELSGGQKQRVMIAMALACDPELLIADEPTTALDVMVQAQVLQLLADLRGERGLAMIFITHDLSVLSTVADRLAVMYAGRLVERGPAKEMLRGAHHPYTKALAAAFPTIGDLSSRLAPSGLAGDPPDPLFVPSGCPFHPRCPIATEECAAAEVELRPLSPDWEAACIKL